MRLQEGLHVAGRYMLVRQLGRGGMGSVWLADHTELRIPCAVKFIEGHQSDDGEYRARFTREARAAASLKSPHVVQILDSGEWEGLPYIAMELLEGESLSQRLRRAKRLAPPECAEIIGQIARALNKAHAAGIVHRDLKPDNVYLTRDDDRLLVKILDFGIAKTATTEGDSTATGTMLGTPAYMSPEQAHGSKRVDARSDLWSVGVITYQCLTGEKPFKGKGVGELIMSVMSGPIPIPSAEAPDLPPGFDAWWARAVSRDPASRFQSARELAQQLGVALGLAPDADPLTLSGNGQYRGSLPSVAEARTASDVPPTTGGANGETTRAVVTPGHGLSKARSLGLVASSVGAAVVIAGGVALWHFVRGGAGGAESPAAGAPIALSVPPPESVAVTMGEPPKPPAQPVSSPPTPPTPEPPALSAPPVPQVVPAPAPTPTPAPRAPVVVHEPAPAAASAAKPAAHKKRDMGF